MSPITAFQECFKPLAAYAKNS